MTQAAKQAVTHAAEATVSDFERLMAGTFKPQQAEAIDNMASGAVEYLSKAGQTVKAALARGIAAKELKKLIADPAVWNSIMELKGKASGWMTDERQGSDYKKEVKYPDSVLQDAIIDAMLDGAQISDCEINVISGRKYLGVSFYRRKLREVASDIIWCPGVPTVMTTTKPGWEGKMAELSIWKVPAVLKFRPNRDGAVGEQMVFDHSGSSHEAPCVGVQYRGSSDTIDGAIGKAERKLRKRAYETCIGRFTEDEPDESPEATDTTETTAASKTISDKIAEVESQKATPTLPATTPIKTPEPTAPIADPPAERAETANPPTPWDDFIKDCQDIAEKTADELGYKPDNLAELVGAAVWKCSRDKTWKSSGGDTPENREKLVNYIKTATGPFTNIFIPPAAETSVPTPPAPTQEPDSAPDAKTIEKWKQMAKEATDKQLQDGRQKVMMSKKEKDKALYAILDEELKSRESKKQPPQEMESIFDSDEPAPVQNTDSEPPKTFEEYIQCVKNFATAEAAKLKMGEDATAKFIETSANNVRNKFNVRLRKPGNNSAELATTPEGLKMMADDFVCMTNNAWNWRVGAPLQ